METQIPVHIRWMIRRDMPEVLATEAESFEFPWLEEDFIRSLQQRNCIGMVAVITTGTGGKNWLDTEESIERCTGFMIFELHKAHIHVLNFAVAEDYRRRGVGSQMIAKLAAKLSAQRRSRIVLEVCETNLAAQVFFRENGFRAVSVLRSYYAATLEDACLMQYRYRPERQPTVQPTSPKKRQRQTAAALGAEPSGNF